MLGSASCVLSARPICTPPSAGISNHWGVRLRAEELLQPTKVAGLSGVATRLACGQQHTCAVVSGILHCWGVNADGQLGVGSRAPVSEPTPPLALGSPVDSVAAGMRHTCATVGGKNIVCERVTAMIHNMRCACSFAGGRVLGIASRGDNGGARLAGPLHGIITNATCGTRDDDVLTAHIAVGEYAAVCCHGRNAETSANVEASVIG